jgi:tyrosyl-tRNA synthetase
MSVVNIAHDLRDRGLISQEGGGEANVFLAQMRKAYLGIDPTADSLHVGNLVPVILMKHLADAGHEIVFIVGGGTGMIGDPRESGERVLLDDATVANNTIAIKKQLSGIFGDKQYEIFNNADWLTRLGIIEFLRDIAKHFTVNQLVKRDIIKKRLDAEDPLSFTEFSYSLLQGYDFLHLYKTEGVDLQVGGSDQWANIISGVDLIRRKESASAYALTTPIIEDKKSGKKFGKSEGNAVWLDPEKTSPFMFYQFWFNLSDDGLEEYLNIFTFMPRTEIAEVMAAHSKEPQKRHAQRVLAHAVTAMIHGETVAEREVHVSDLVFGGDFSAADLSDNDLENVVTSLRPHVVTDTELEQGFGISAALVASGLAPSKSEARRLVESGAVSVNGASVNAPDFMITEASFVRGILFVRAGKKTGLLRKG